MERVAHVVAEVGFVVVEWSNAIYIVLSASLIKTFPSFFFLLYFFKKLFALVSQTH